MLSAMKFCKSAILNRLIESVCALGAEKFFRSHSEEGGWDPEGYRQWLMHLFPVTFEQSDFDQEHLEIEQMEETASSRVIEAFKEKLNRENAKVPAKFIEEGEPPHPAHDAVRNLMIRKIDQMWQEHLLRMDHLRSDVTLRSVGQRDPLLEFKHEAFALFDELSRNLRTEIVRAMFRFEIITPQQTLQQLLAAGLKLETNRSLFADFQAVPPPGQENGIPNQPEERQEVIEEKLEPVITGPKTGRNEACPCGSGKKYKKCCGQKETD
jgi:preprotein translocase subunit SecA